MKVAIISCFETYQNRIDDMEKYYILRGNEVTIIKSNFLHFKKEKINNENLKPNVSLIDVPSYSKNISLKRVISHKSFSKQCAAFLEKEKFDLIHVLVPPNTLCKEIIKIEHEAKIIFDVIDFWPETMPIKKMSNTFVYRYWKNIRDKYIAKSDFILTECRLFQEKLIENVLPSKIETIYFTREIIPNSSNYQLEKDVDRIELVYLGSINNIIDIELIVSILTEINKTKKVLFNIVGDGESKHKMIKLLKENKISYLDYGVVYDLDLKKQIFQKCSFAFNIMKKEVFVGLTMKSIDYFQFGIPIINNISHDTEYLVDKYSVGVNIKRTDTIENITKTIISQSALNVNFELRENVLRMFEEEFLFKNLEFKMDDVIKKIGLN